MNFDEAFALLVSPRIEGEYSDHPDDNGGKTRYGITEAEARRVGYRGDMRELPLSLARSIYLNEYWEPVQADNLPPQLRYYVFDAAVNSGVRRATFWLQQALGVKVDGIIGPQTLAAAKNADVEATIRHMLAARLRFFTSLTDWKAFGKGWTNRVATLLEL